MKASQPYSKPSQASQKEKEKPLRAKMPEVAAFLDSLREAFGPEVIDQAVRQGMRGEPTFFAEENGIRIGTVIARGGVAVHRDAAGNMILGSDR